MFEQSDQLRQKLQDKAIKCKDDWILADILISRARARILQKYELNISINLLNDALKISKISKLVHAETCSNSWLGLCNLILNDLKLAVHYSTQAMVLLEKSQWFLPSCDEEELLLNHALVLYGSEPPKSRYYAMKCSLEIQRKANMIFKPEWREAFLKQPRISRLHEILSQKWGLT